MFTTNLTLLMPVIGVAAGLVAAMLVVRSHDLRLASVGFTGKSSRLLVPHHTAEAVMVAVGVPLAIVLLGCSLLALREYLRPVAVATEDGTHHHRIIKLPPVAPPIDPNNPSDPGSIVKTPTGGGIPKPVEAAPGTDVDPGTQSSWAQQANAGTVDPSLTGGDSVTYARPGDDPSQGYVELAKAPELIRKIEPVYPSIAIKSGSEGRVYIQALLDIDGHVLRVELQRSSGNPVLDEAALEAVKQWVFTPAIAPDGRPTKVWQMCPIVFRIAN